MGLFNGNRPGLFFRFACEDSSSPALYPTPSDRHGPPAHFLAHFLLIVSVRFSKTRYVGVPTARLLVDEHSCLDINGVLVEDRAPIPGAIEVLSEAGAGD